MDYKISAKGLMQVYWNERKQRLFLKDDCTWEEEVKGELIEIFRDGEILNEESLFEIRKRINNG